MFSFLTKLTHNEVYKHVNYERKFSIFQTFMFQTLREKCPNTEFFLVRISLYSVQIPENTDQNDPVMTQFTNLGIEKNLQYIFTSNNSHQVIHKWSRKYNNKHSIIKHVLKLSNDIILMLNFICWKLHYL